MVIARSLRVLWQSSVSPALVQGVAEGRGDQVTPGRGLHCGRRAALFSLPRCEQAPGKAALPCSIGLRVQLFSAKKRRLRETLFLSTTI